MVAYFNVLVRQFFRNWGSLFIFLFPSMLLVGLGKLMPAAWIVPSTITLSIAISVMFTFGPNLFEVRKTSIIKAMSLTTLSKWKVFTTSALFSTFISFISVFIVLATSYILTEPIDFLITDYSTFLENGDLLVSRIYWKDCNRRTTKSTT